MARALERLVQQLEQSFTPGKPVPLQLEWLPDGGLISLHHSTPGRC